jgi:hypothetical protein
VDLDVRALEQELGRIPEVSAARVVVSDAGRPLEVHVLATPAKHVKQIVRDIQSVAMAQFSLELDHRIVSVVQLEGQTAAGEAGGGHPGHGNGFLKELRIVIEGVTAVRDGLRCTAQVSLRRDEEAVLGVAEGSAASSVAPRLVAEATLDALRRLEPGASRADIEDAAVVRMGERRVAVVTLVLLVPPYEEVVVGSAVVRGSAEQEALCRAVLDGTNRRLAQLAQS